MRILMTIIFHVLYTFRGLMQGAFKLIGGFCLLGAIAAAIFGQYKTAGVGAIMAVVFSFLGWSYDTILLKLQPPGTNLTLYQ